MGERLTGRVAIVTGAGRGIGKGVALQLAEEGASVVVNDLGVEVDGTGASSAPAEEVVQEIRKAGGAGVTSADSVAEFDTASKIVQTAIDNFGRLDILCHAAGFLRDRMVFNMTEEEWDAVLQVHLYGAFNMVRNAIPHMIEQKYGRIVLFASGSGLGASGQTNYAAAKEGIVGFVRTLARELSPFGIAVNAIYPGGATRMIATIPESTTQLRQQQGEEEESAEESEEAFAAENNAPKVAHLCTEAGGSITGQVIGTSGWPMTLYSPRHVIKSIHKNERWTLDELDQLIPASLGAGLVNPVPPQPPRQQSS